MRSARLVTFALTLLSATLSKWLYDVGKAYGIFAPRPTLVHLVIPILCFVLFLILLALPQLRKRKPLTSHWQDLVLFFKTPALFSPRLRVVVNPKNWTPGLGGMSVV